MNWSDSVCLVTGASSGIGRATAVALAARGATVIAVARREERLAELIEEIGGAPHSYVVCDVGDLDQVKRLATQVGRRTERLDALINVAGIPGGGPVPKNTPETAERVIRTNLLGPIWCTQLLMPLLDRAPRGTGPTVVNMASMAGRIPLPGSGIYTATKFGLVGFTEAIWGEMRAKGIKVMSMEPGFVHTEGFPMDLLLRNPLLRGLVMTPERIAEALCSAMERGKPEVMVQGWWPFVYHISVLTGPIRRQVSRLVWRRFGRQSNF